MLSSLTEIPTSPRLPSTPQLPALPLWRHSWSHRWLRSPVSPQPGATSSRWPRGTILGAIATGLSSPRHIVIDTAGNLLRLVLKDDGTTVCVTSKTAVTKDRSTNYGIALSADGKTLFTSNLSSVTAYPYDASMGTAGIGKVITVARGSNGSIDTATTSQLAGRSMIKTFSMSNALATAAQYVTDGEVLGWGLRNIVGMGEDPVYGGVRSVENSLDEARVGVKDVHNDNPAEKASYHGVLNNTANKLKGANYGGIQVGTLFTLDSVLKATDCASREPGWLHFHAHTAPLDIKFNANATHAHATFHGSWNRNPADGYRVAGVAFRDGQPVAERSSKTAQTMIMENTESCPDSCFRPVGLDFDKKGHLVLYCTVGFIAFFMAVGGTIMQLLGVHRNCECKAGLIWCLPTTHYGRDTVQVKLSTDTQVDRDQSWTWTGLGVSGVVRLVVLCTIAAWHRVRVRQRCLDLIKELNSSSRRLNAAQGVSQSNSAYNQRRHNQQAKVDRDAIQVDSHTQEDVVILKKLLY
ncbi:hypothetical protein B0H67DRAFT_646266 [Lasiosphaeris hirsuta]|uniref:Pyrroloquinoline quinone-dependent pyranose dehydrogenase beta-propeller domain-containing protein n=1 Tax=Lasiosphaeris hirsuta TaxID=260670 RepID=A0AA40DPI5_9PEZI|nr:hypothetical protein B0H67DRAFT_646266 [Lasiosphaeris hirsuta]